MPRSEERKKEKGKRKKSVIQAKAWLLYIILRFLPCLNSGINMIVHFSYFHSIMSYGIVLCGNEAGMQSIFVLQKQAIR